AAPRGDPPLVADPLVEERQDRNGGIGRLESGPGAEVHADRHRGCGEEALAPQRILQRLTRQAPAARVVVEGEVVRRDREFYARRIVIAQVLADALQLMHRRNAERTQETGLPDAGELQGLGRVDRAAADDDFARCSRLALVAADRIAHTRATPALEDQ